MTEHDAIDGRQGGRDYWHGGMRLALAVVLAAGLLWLVVVGAWLASNPREQWGYTYFGPFIFWQFLAAWEDLSVPLWLGVAAFVLALGAVLRLLPARAVEPTGRAVGWLLLLVVMHEVLLMDLFPALGPPERLAGYGPWQSMEWPERMVQLGVTVTFLVLWSGARTSGTGRRRRRAAWALIAFWVVATVGLSFYDGGFDLSTAVAWTVYSVLAAYSGVLTRRRAGSCQTT